MGHLNAVALSEGKVHGEEQPVVVLGFAVVRVEDKLAALLLDLLYHVAVHVGRQLVRPSTGIRLAPHISHF